MFIAHLNNPKTKPQEIIDFLEIMFGDRREAGWYVGRNYERPYNESEIEVQFSGYPNKKHLLFGLVHPYTIIQKWDETITTRENAKQFNLLFEVADAISSH